MTKDRRTWAQRVCTLDENWKPKIPLLVTAYLRWKHPSPEPISTHPHLSQEPSAEPHHPDILPSTMSSEDGSPDPQHPDVSPVTSAVKIDVIDIYSGATSAEIPVAGDQTFAEVLVAAGYLGTTPIYPSLAISLRTLELLRVIRLFKASFSIEAFTKMICYMYYVRNIV